MLGLYSLRILVQTYRKQIVLGGLQRVGLHLGQYDGRMRYSTTLGSVRNPHFGSLEWDLSRYGRRPVLLCAMAYFGIMGTACAFAPNIATLLFTSFVQGTATPVRAFRLCVTMQDSQF